MWRKLPKLTELARVKTRVQTQVCLTPEHMLFSLHCTERSRRRGDCLVDWRDRRQKEKMEKKVRTGLRRVLSAHHERGEIWWKFPSGKNHTMIVNMHWAFSKCQALCQGLTYIIALNTQKKNLLWHRGYQNSHFSHEETQTQRGQVS